VAGATYETAEALRHDDTRPPTELSQRAEIEVIVMSVGDQDGVNFNVLEKVGDRRGLTLQRAETVDKQRIGEDPRAVEVEEDGRMTEVTQTGAHPPSLMRRS
jgi:hypothetical protein